MMHASHEHRLVLAVAGVAIGLSTTGIRAQTPLPNAPTPDSSTPADPRQDPRATGSTARPGESLSDRLERTEGVIRPPGDITPDNTIRPPDPGTTPVIPPPGSPGGNTRVEPK